MLLPFTEWKFSQVSEWTNVTLSWPRDQQVTVRWSYVFSDDQLSRLLNKNLFFMNDYRAILCLELEVENKNENKKINIYANVQKRIEKKGTAVKKKKNGKKLTHFCLCKNLVDCNSALQLSCKIYLCCIDKNRRTFSRWLFIIK